MESDLIGLLLLIGYFLPSIVATTRRHNNATAIFVINLSAGWSLIGWVGALVWACTDNVDSGPRQHMIPHAWAPQLTKQKRKMQPPPWDIETEGGIERFMHPSELSQKSNP